MVHRVCTGRIKEIALIILHYHFKITPSNALNHWTYSMTDWLLCVFDICLLLKYVNQFIPLSFEKIENRYGGRYAHELVPISSA